MSEKSKPRFWPSILILIGTLSLFIKDFSGLGIFLVFIGFLGLVKQFEGTNNSSSSSLGNLNPVDNTKPLPERYHEVIQEFAANMREDHWPYYVENVVRDCLGKIAIHDGKSYLAPKSREWLKDWQKRSDVPQDYLLLKDYLLETFNARYKEVKEIKRAEMKVQEEERQRKEDEENQVFFDKYKELIDKFLEISERKVSIIDDYGDENWDALPDEIDILITKIAKLEGKSKSDINDYFKKGYSWKLGEEYSWLERKLDTFFREYHETQKKRPSNNGHIDLNKLSGHEFETFIAKVLKENGFADVRGTPLTGDQGADLIAKRDGKTIIIQAKRYIGHVGNKAVQEVVSALKYYNGDEAWVITNSTFTPSAKALAQKTNVKLIDGRSFSNFADYLKTNFV